MPMFENHTGNPLGAASFESDIFISYAHIDDATFHQGDKGWITNLHRALELRVGQLYGKAPRIWRDPKLQGNEAFADRLDSEVPKSALLVSVLSPRYLRSDWCQRELKTFIAASQYSGGLRFADKSRVFKVVKTPIPLDKQPSMMQKMLGYEFFQIDPETGRPSELNPDDPEIRRHYWSRLDDLAYDICQMLEHLENIDDLSTEAVQATTAPQAEPKIESVYLAETTADLRQEHDALRRDLQLRGYRVLPAQPLPLVADELIAAVRADLARCRLSIHPVGRNFGIVPEGATDSGSVLQSELAIERFSDGEFTRLVWLPRGLETHDERQAAFLERLRTDPRLASGADLLECPLESLKTEIRLRLETPAETATTAAPAAPAAPATSMTSSGVPEDEGLRRIYLVHDQRDEDAVIDLEEHLFERGFEVMVSAFEGDEAQVRRDHQESLCECDAVLLYYGAGNDPWLRRKLREVQKSAAFGRQRPLLGTAIYVAPPDTARKARLKTREAVVIHGKATFEPSQLEPFIQGLGQPQERPES